MSNEPAPRIPRAIVDGSGTADVLNVNPWKEVPTVVPNRGVPGLGDVEGVWVMIFD